MILRTRLKLLAARRRRCITINGGDTRVGMVDHLRLTKEGRGKTALFLS
jgi:hypothetical protein